MEKARSASSVRAFGTSRHGVLESVTGPDLAGGRPGAQP